MYEDLVKLAGSFTTDRCNETEDICLAAAAQEGRLPVRGPRRLPRLDPAFQQAQAGNSQGRHIYPCTTRKRVMHLDKI